MQLSVLDQGISFREEFVNLGPFLNYRVYITMVSIESKCYQINYSKLNVFCFLNVFKAEISLNDIENAHNCQPRLIKLISSYNLKGAVNTFL